MKLLAFVAVLVASLCVTAGTAAAEGALRVLHASPDAPAVDVYVNGRKAVPSLKPGAITPYLTLEAGRYAWAIRPKGAPKGSQPVARGRIRDRRRQGGDGRGDGPPRRLRHPRLPGTCASPISPSGRSGPRSCASRTSPRTPRR